MSQKIQTVPDVIPGSVWHSKNLGRFLVKSVIADAGELWVYYEEIGSKRSYHCLVEAFQARFTPYLNHIYGR